MPLRVFFFLAGFAVANWTVRIPAVKDQVGASTSELGLALLCLSIGGIGAMAFGGRACLRFGSRRVVTLAGTTTFAMLPLPASVGSVPSLAGALLLYGSTYGLFNIALNNAAVEHEHAVGRPVMSGLHGLYSGGALVGAVVGGVAAGFLSPSTHLWSVALVGLLLCGLLARCRDRVATGDGRSPRSASAARSGRWGAIGLFGVVAFCTAFTEFANNDWAVLHLRTDLGAAPTAAAFGYAAYECAITVARLVGDRGVRRFGGTAVLAGGALLATAGILVASRTSSLGVAFTAYLAIGLGVANIFPIAVARAGALGGPQAVGVVAPLGSVGILIERPLIGFAADHVGLPNALSAVALLTLLAAGLGLTERLLLRPSAASGGSTEPETTHRDCS